MPPKISSTQNEPADNKTALLFCLVLALSLFLFFFRLGDRPFRNPDEGRYATIAQEMVITGDWGVPTLFGLAYLKKPILFYWLEAGSLKLWGMNEWAARLVPALFGVLGIAAVFAFSLRYWGRRSAFMISLILASNFWYLQVGRYLVIDMVFSFFLVAASFSFYIANTSKADKEKNFYWLFFILMGLAFLTKGPVSLAVTGCSIAAYLVATGRLKRTLIEIKWGRGLILFCFVALPWFFWVAQRQPQFIGQFFGHENWNRVFSSSFEHQEPWYFYGMVLIPMLMPWILFWRPLSRAWDRSEPRSQADDPRLFLMISGCVTILFYSLAKAKLATYILPAIIYFSVLVGYSWSQWTRESPAKASFKDGWPVIVLILAGVTLVAVSPWFVLERSHGKYPTEIVNYFQYLGGALLAGGVFCAKSLRQNRRDKLFYALVVLMAVMSLIFPRVMETMNVNYSTKKLALALNKVLKASDEVYVYDQPGAFYDFPFYLDHPVKLVGLEGELEFSRLDKRADVVSVSRERFNNMLADRQMFYCLIRRSDFMDIGAPIRDQLTIVSEDKRKVLFRSGVPSEVL
jgi:4-amino-4-deoxy-L-arabinose transferase-like glycosyltransferase